MGMTDAELSDALDGLYAYDTGCRDSGIKDERLRSKVQVEFFTDPERTGSQLISVRMSRIVREMFLSEEALSQGYGLEDVAHFLRWLDDEMGIGL